MNRQESRTLARAAAVLLAAGAVRWVVEGAPPPAPVDPSSSALAALDSAVTAEVAVETRANTPLADDERLDPNVADVVELRRLPGVGPATAEAIVRSREAEGPFTRPDDLERVRGIGPATVAKIMPHLAFTSAHGLAAIAPPGPEPVDLNQAGVEALDALPGIGPALAGRIVESRARDGPFRRADDLLRVRGIGPALLERLRPRVRPGGG